MTYQGIFGCDISTYQDAQQIPGHVDFNKMKSYGMDFVIFRASNGIRQDEDFISYWIASQGILPRGAYHFFNNLRPPKDQAVFFWNVIKNYYKGETVYLDLEDTQSGYYGWRHWYDWLENFKQISGIPSSRIGIYTGYYYWTELFIKQPATYEQKKYFTQYPLWLAQYFHDPFNPDLENVLTPFPFSRFIMLQSGTPAIGIEAGVESKEIDLDLFLGSPDEFGFHFGSVDTPTPSEGDTMLKIATVIVTSLRIRSTPSTATQDNIIGTLYKGDKVIGTIDANGWMYLEKIIRVNGTVQPFVGYSYTVSNMSDIKDYAAVSPSHSVSPSISVSASPSASPSAGPTDPLPVLTVTLAAPGYPTYSFEWKPL